MGKIKIDIQELNQLLGQLVKSRNDVLIDQIPEVIREELVNNLIGKTIYKRNNQIWINYVDFLNWVKSKYE